MSGWATISRRNASATCSLVGAAIQPSPAMPKARSNSTPPATSFANAPDRPAKGGFKWSSQHFVMKEVCDECCEASAGDSCGAWPDVVACRKRGVRIGSGSGRRSRMVFRARMRLVRLGCRRRLGRDGSGRLVGCRRFVWVRCRAAICRLPSGKRSPFVMRRVLGCVRSVAVWVVVRRRFRGRCGVTLLFVVEVWLIGQRLRSGTRSGVPVAPRFPSWPRTTPCASTSRIALVA